MDNGVGLVWDKGLLGTADWDRNGGTEGVEFGTEIVSTAPQIGEIFKMNGSPFEDWAKVYPNEPNNSGTEWLAHTVGLGNCDARSQIAESNKEDCEKKYELYWNDLPEKQIGMVQKLSHQKGLLLSMEALKMKEIQD